MTPAGIEPATFRFVAQHLHHCATAVPQDNVLSIIIHRNFKIEVLDINLLLCSITSLLKELLFLSKIA